MEILPLTGELLEKIRPIDSKAFTSLVISDFATAEKLYSEYYTILRNEEDQKLEKNQKYHKGTPLHNWGIALLNQGKIDKGFEKIILAYIEDLLNATDPKDALKAPAYITLFSNEIIDKEFLKEIYSIVDEFRKKEHIPKNPQEIVAAYIERRAGKADLSASLTVKNTNEIPTIKASNPKVPLEGTPDVSTILQGLGDKARRVFIGGGHRNIALLRGIRDIVAEIGKFTPILVSDFELELNEHDKSMAFLKGCAFAIFEISISNGHLMEIERSYDFENEGSLKFVLLYQGIKDTSDPKTTAMLDKFKDHMVRYMNLEELKERVNEFLPKN